jgi:SAM-dependent methyltransferase
MKYDMSSRVESYRKSIPGTKWPSSIPYIADDRMYGIFVLGQNYRNKSKLYGAFPPNLLLRIVSFFPDKTDILHPFGGSLIKEQVEDDAPWANHTRVDIIIDDVRNPDIQADVHSLPFDDNSFDLIISDPPYSSSDAEKYSTKMINRKKVLRELRRVSKESGHLVWLDTQLPMFRKIDWELVGLIGIVRSTNHRVRLLSFFKAGGNN